jgi:hypothetical protein
MSEVNRRSRDETPGKPALKRARFPAARKPDEPTAPPAVVAPGFDHRPGAWPHRGIGLNEKEIRMSTRDVFDELVTASATDLFRARGIDVRPASRSEASVEYAATIGFSTDGMRGMIGLGMSPETLHSLVARDGHAGPAFNAEDWLAESVNQLLGRLKNKLMGYGVTLSIALPSVLRGVRLEFVGTRSTTLWTSPLDSDAGRVWVWLDVRTDRELVLVQSNDPEMQGTPEGELLLF